MAALTLTLDRRARKFVRWVVDASDPDLTYTLNLGRDTVWHPMERVGSTVRVLVAGPDATDNPPGTIVAPLGASVCTIRVPDTPEVDVAPHGVIVVR